MNWDEVKIQGKGLGVEFCVEGFVLEVEDDKNGFVDSASKFFLICPYGKVQRTSCFSRVFMKELRYFDGGYTCEGVEFHGLDWRHLELERNVVAESCRKKFLWYQNDGRHVILAFS